ncbi:uncharacterized protein LOC113960386 isoform X2 [Corapipo altera]|uniref:uncharacterized protein LOC113960386 isoform X2 n=1 Tax=Corapipo altera TaxID=415028 RepID=UPI000FD650A9|nr:uncharacterized protein LOC113960386 isoform X2 [Corapipo altera]
MVGNWEPFHGGSPGSIPQWEPVILPMAEAQNPSDGGSPGSIPRPTMGAQDPFPWWEPRTFPMARACDHSHGGNPGSIPLWEPGTLSHDGNPGSIPLWEPGTLSHGGSTGSCPQWDPGTLPTVGSRDPSHSGIPGSLPWCQWPWHGQAGSGTARIWQEQPVSVPGLQPGKGAAPGAPISFKITKSQAGVPAWGGIFAPSTSARRDFPSSCSLGHCRGHGEGGGCPWDDPGKDVMVLPQRWTQGMDSGMDPRDGFCGMDPRLDTVGWAPWALVGSARCTIPGWMDLTCSTGKDTKHCWISLYIPIFPGSKLLSCLAPPGQGCPRAPGVSRCPRRVPCAVSARCYLCYHRIALE